MSKIGVVGAGFVGATAAYAMVMSGVGSELVLVDINQKRAQAEADDILHAVPFAHAIRVKAGEYAALDGCKVVIVSAGVGQKPGESRLELLKRNAAIFGDVIPEVIKHAPGAIVVVATNPVDILTHLAARIARDHGVSPSHVMGSGTTLDTARFRALLGAHLGVAASNVHGYVIGEHGDSEVLAWSLVTVGTIPLQDFCKMHDSQVSDALRKKIDRQVRGAAYAIIEGKGATYYGIGSALARIVQAIIDDQHAVLTVCSPMPEVVGVLDVTLALPHIIGQDGVLGTLTLPLNQEEEQGLRDSANIIKEAIDQIEAAR